MQTNRVHNWPEHIKYMTEGSVFKIVDDVGMAKDAKIANPNILVDIRFWRDWMQQFDSSVQSTRTRARQFIASWLNESFREAAPYIDMVEDFNEYWAVSHTPEETSMRILWVEQLLWVWYNEILPQPENSGLRHIRWCLGNAAVGNNIPWEVAKMAYDGGHYIGYHGYISIASRDLPESVILTTAIPMDFTGNSSLYKSLAYRENMRDDEGTTFRVTNYLAPSSRIQEATESVHVIPGERSPNEFIWGSGRILQQDIHEYQPRGIYPKYVITEGGPIRDANGRAWLQPNDGWRHKNCENGNIDRYIRHTREVYDLYHEWNKHNDNRLIGYVDFTSGANDWKDFDLGGGELEVLLREISTWPEDEVAPPPPDPVPLPLYAHGMDLSHHNIADNMQFDYAKAASNGVAFVWVKASDGNVVNFSQENWYLDPEYLSNSKQALKGNFLIGSYHYFAASKPVQPQLDNFLLQLNQLDVQNLPPVLDLEEEPEGTTAAYHSRVIEWLEAVEQVTGQQPIIYTAKYFADDYLDSSLFDGYKLWIANYKNPNGPAMPDRRDKDDWSFWQYSGDDNNLGKEYGVQSGSIDRNHYNGTEGELLDLYGDNWIEANNEPLMVLTPLRKQYKRYTHVIPPWATPKEEEFIFEVGRSSKNSFMFSYDDAGATPVSDNTAVLWDIPPEQQRGYVLWFANFYKDTQVEFFSYPVDIATATSNQLKDAVQKTMALFSKIELV
jgi:GH25 family lysozyme M1 (1,4-beta-N-acetylmuramidase)